ncbi:hypothetical protein AAVH_21950 [Aphelenchoides avenae]|nr:hypothetical protein AAVH_21950 [Aphelenchus avenae]
MNKWSAYSISISLVFVRYANYCACVSPLRFTDVLSMRNLWIAAAVISDLLGVAVAVFDDLEFFDIVIDLRVKALVMAVVALGIWLSELIISLLTVVQVVKYLRKRSVASKQESRNISKMTSFLLFSISPAIQLLPFVYTDVNSAWEDLKFYWFIECMDKFGDVANLPMEELNKLTEQCGVDHG